MLSAQPDQAVRVYPAKGRVGWQAALCLIGGILFLLMLVVMFVLALAVEKPGRSGPDMMPGMIGGMSVIGIALVGRGIFLLKSLQRVLLDESGVHLEGFIGRQTVRWADIERLERDKQNSLMGATTDVLKIVGKSGKPVATIPDTLMDFPQMVAEIEARSSAVRGAATYDPSADAQRRATKEAKTQKLAVVCFGIFVLLFGGMFCFGINEEIHLRRYASEAVRVDAPIVRRWMVKITPRLEYAFKDQGGVEHRREVMLTQQAWDALEESKTVPVEYLASDPEWSRPISGEQTTSFAGKFLLLTGGGTLVMGFLFVFALLGYDLKSENGKTRLTRRGKVIREFGKGEKWSDAFNPPPTPCATAPVEYASPTTFPPAPAVPAQRSYPAGLIVLGILCIVFGLIEAALAGLRALLWSRQFVTLPDGRIIITSVQPWLHWWNTADAVVALLLVITGIQLLRRKLAARTLGLLVASIQILSCVGNIIMQIVQASGLPEQTGPGSMHTAAAQTAAILVQLIAMIFPIVLLTILARRRTAEALAPEVRVQASPDRVLV